MSIFRNLSSQERAVITTLLRGTPQAAHLTEALDGLLVKDMSDGGMGSLLLVPIGLEHIDRQFGRQLVLGEFTDIDDVPVSIAIHVDDQGRLYEFDVWKVNFSRLIQWPDLSGIRIIG